MPSSAPTRLTFSNAAAAFAEDQVQRPRRYRRKTDELRTSRFLRDPQRFDPRTVHNRHVSYEISNASREVVSGIVAPLRLLYSQRENVSFVRTRNMIGRRAALRRTDDAEALFALLAVYKTRLTRIHDTRSC